MTVKIKINKYVLLQKCKVGVSFTFLPICPTVSSQTSATASPGEILNHLYSLMNHSSCSRLFLTEVLYYLGKLKQQLEIKFWGLIKNCLELEHWDEQN